MPVMSEIKASQERKKMLQAARDGDEDAIENLTLEDMDEVLMWYNDIKPDKTVEIVNYLGQQAAAGTQVFYDIYTEEEK